MRILSIGTGLACLFLSTGVEAVEDPGIYVAPTYACDSTYGKQRTAVDPSFEARLSSHVAARTRAFVEELKRVRPNTFQLREQQILSGDGHNYPVLNWRYAASLGRIEIHRIEPLSEGRVRFRFLRQVEGDVRLRRPTGEVAFPGEPAVVVICRGSGGSGAEGYWLEVIQLSRRSANIVPDWVWRPVDLIDLDGDGRHELIALETRWRNYFYCCSACGPHVPIVLERNNERFQPVCGRYAEMYKQRIAVLQPLADAPDDGAWRRDYLAKIALIQAQIGAFEAAERAFDRLLAVVAEGQTGAGSHDEYLNILREEIGDLIRRARDWAYVTCPLSAVTGGGHHGFNARVERLRALPD